MFVFRCWCCAGSKMLQYARSFPNQTVQGSLVIHPHFSDKDDPRFAFRARRFLWWYFHVHSRLGATGAYQWRKKLGADTTSCIRIIIRAPLIFSLHSSLIDEIVLQCVSWLFLYENGGPLRTPRLLFVNINRCWSRGRSFSSPWEFSRLSSFIFVSSRYSITAMVFTQLLNHSAENDWATLVAKCAVFFFLFQSKKLSWVNLGNCSLDNQVFRASRGLFCLPNDLRVSGIDRALCLRITALTLRRDPPKTLSDKWRKTLHADFSLEPHLSIDLIFQRVKILSGE